MSQAPSGTVTFLFTDIEGSTVLWDRSPHLMGAALARHDELVRDAVEQHAGFVFALTGDGFAAAFAEATAAVDAAVDAQRALVDEPWHEEARVRVRMGLHTGVAEQRESNYFGTDVNRTARIACSGWGGQILLSGAAAEQARIPDGGCLVDLGHHRLEGLRRSEQLFRLDVPTLPVVNAPPRLSEGATGNLPHRRANLIGRDRELAELDRRMRPGGVVTVTGVGGVGKTRLAVAAARAVQSRYADGAWLVELGHLTSAYDVVPAAATALQLVVSGAADPATAVAEAIDRQARLIVLDNCEHVIDAAVELVEALGQRCPNVTVLATSREALLVEGEQVMPIRPMSVDGKPGTSAAAQLFIERATGALGSFDPDEHELVLVDRICQRVDGLPLAIELAAARLPSMGLTELESKLDDRFRLLTRRRGSVERHQSLRTTVAWSYDLLTPDEQLVFERVSVFAGGFDADSAAAVAGGQPLHEPVEEVLASLVAKSLLVASRVAQGVRYQQLETVRQFAEERLNDRSEGLAVRRRHLDHFLAWARRMDTHLKTEQELRSHEAFLDEWHNLRNAFGWACELADADAACSMIAESFWWAATRVRLEIGEWCDAALRLPTAADHPLRPIVAAASAYAAFMRNDVRRSEELLALARAEELRLGELASPWVPTVAGYPDSSTSLTQGLADAGEVVRRARAAGNPFWELVGVMQEISVRALLVNVGHLTDDERAAHRARIREAAEFAEQFANPNGIAHACMALGGALRATEPDRALALLERSLGIAVRLDLELTANHTRRYLAQLYADLGRHEDAIVLMGPTIQRHRRAGAWSTVWLAITALAAPLAATGHPRLAARVLGGARAQPDWEVTRALHDLDRLDEELRETLGSTALDQLLVEGAAMDVTDLAGRVLTMIDELIP